MPETNENGNPTDATPNVADQTSTVVVQVSAEDLKPAVHDTLVEMWQSAVASSQSALVDLITLPFRAASDWLRWMQFGDQTDLFGKRAGSKQWPTAKS